MKYSTSIGQNTGILKASKNVQIIAIIVLLVIAYQNLNSGKRRINGRNSSFDLVGNSGPSSIKNKENSLSSWLHNKIQPLTI